MSSRRNSLTSCFEVLIHSWGFFALFEGLLVFSKSGLIILESDFQVFSHWDLFLEHFLEQ